MTNNTLIKTGIALGAGALLALAGALPASAHVGVTASTTAAGSTALLSFNVPHGCDGSPTTVISIELPESIIAATPTVVAGWDATKVTAEMAATSDAHGNEVTERVAEVVYTATDGGLADGFRQQFDVQVQLPDLEAGTALEFPVTQTCVVGETVWDGEDTPTVTLSAAAADAHGHDDADSEDHEAVADEGAASDTGTSGSTDVLARVLGIGGLVVGTAGIVAAVVARRGARTGS